MSPELEAVVVDQILSLCVNEVEFSELIDMMQKNCYFLTPYFKEIFISPNRLRLHFLSGKE
jgi:hypothetical protein